MTLAQFAEVVSGRLSQVDPDVVVRGPVVIDSRRVRDGAVFAAFVGDRVDGHDFARQAVGAGAVAVLASRPVDVPAVMGVSRGASARPSPTSCPSTRLPTRTLPPRKCRSPSTCLAIDYGKDTVKHGGWCLIWKPEGTWSS
jgi:UDP-N-acetylmuramoyl-tripeptide--D-alanyl-D-alanine ligase